MTLEEDYQRAFDAVRKSLMTIRAAADAWNVNRSTLHSFLMKGKVPDRIKQGRFKPTFSSEQEDALVEYLIELSEVCQGMTRKAFGVLAFKTAVKLGLAHRFKGETAGRCFITSFLKRHKDRLSMRTATPLTQQRVEGFCPTSVRWFQEKLQGILGRYAITSEFIFNVDESGITIVPPQRQQLIAKLGAKNVPIMVPCERGQLVTLICCMSAAGSHLPPFFVFKGTNSFSTETEIGPNGSRSTCSPKGWCTQESFLQWLHFFHETVAPPPGQHLLLIFDNASAHVNVDGIEFGIKNNIHMLSIPSHTSHKLQPMDVGFFRPLKSRYAESVRVWQLTHGMQKPQVRNIPEMLKPAFEASSKIETVVNAFRKCGIWDPELEGPNPNAFSDADYRAYYAALKRKQLPEVQPQDTPIELSPSDDGNIGDTGEAGGENGSGGGFAEESDDDEDSILRRGYGLLPDAVNAENEEADDMPNAPETRSNSSVTRSSTKAAATSAYQELYPQTPVLRKRQRLEKKTRRQESTEYTTEEALKELQLRKQASIDAKEKKRLAQEAKEKRRLGQEAKKLEGKKKQRQARKPKEPVARPPKGRKPLPPAAKGKRSRSKKKLP